MARVQVKKPDKKLMLKPWNETLFEMIREDGEFRRAFLWEVIRAMATGDVDAGKSLLRKYINATVGFIELGKVLGRSSKTLMQMLGPRGNPNIKNFFEIVAYLQKREGSVFEEAA